MPPSASSVFFGFDQIVYNVKAQIQKVISSALGQVAM